MTIVITIHNMNVKYELPAMPWEVKVDRQTRLGNPCRVNISISREEACLRYEVYFQRRIAEDRAFKARLYELIDIAKRYGQLDLYCWCTPLQCHAETIKRYIEQELKAQNIAL